MERRAGRYNGVAKQPSHVQNLPGGPLPSTAVPSPGGCAIYGQMTSINPQTTAGTTTINATFDFPVVQRSTINIQIAYSVTNGGSFTTTWFVNKPVGVAGTAVVQQLSGSAANQMLSAVITRDPITTNGGNYTVTVSMGSISHLAGGWIMFTAIVGGNTESDDVTYA